MITSGGVIQCSIMCFLMLCKGNTGWPKQVICSRARFCSSFEIYFVSIWNLYSRHLWSTYWDELNQNGSLQVEVTKVIIWDNLNQDVIWLANLTIYVIQVESQSDILMHRSDSASISGCVAPSVNIYIKYIQIKMLFGHISHLHIGIQNQLFYCTSQSASIPSWGGHISHIYSNQDVIYISGSVQSKIRYSNAPVRFCKHSKLRPHKSNEHCWFTLSCLPPWFICLLLMQGTQSLEVQAVRIIE